MEFEARLVQAAKAHLEQAILSKPGSGLLLRRHLGQVDIWTGRLLGIYPEADATAVKLGVWLHDIGRAIGPAEVDHAVNSETEARRFLPTIDARPALVEQVAHIVRSHRCKDVLPETLEARILAACDSASHMTDAVYVDMANRGEKNQAEAKLERDLRDVGQFPELREMLLPLYGAWKGLLAVYPPVNPDQLFKLT